MEWSYVDYFYPSEKSKSVKNLFRQVKVLPESGFWVRFLISDVLFFFCFFFMYLQLYIAGSGRWSSYAMKGPFINKHVKAEEGMTVNWVVAVSSLRHKNRDFWILPVWVIRRALLSPAYSTQKYAWIFVMLPVRVIWNYANFLLCCFCHSSEEKESN